MNRTIAPLAAAIALSQLVANPAIGQEFALEEIVVTAQKRAQDMQDVPIAVTAMNADMLKKAGISDIKGIAVRTPGFSMGDFNPTQPQLFIRGIGSNGDGAGGGESSVAMFLDGVYINRSAGAGTELYDLESVEVLRGPQGTLWGKNAIAGAINLTSKRPADQFESSLEVGAGNFGLRSLRGMATGPLSDNLNGKVSVSRKRRDGYVDSVVADIETGDLDNQNLRGQLLYTPSDDMEILFTLDYGVDQRNGPATRPSDQHHTMAYYLATQAIPKAGFHENYLESSGDTEMNSKGVSIQVDWDLDIGTLTSLTAYRAYQSDLQQISLGTGLKAYPLIDLNNFSEDNSEMLSQEFRLAGESDNLTWQTGLYLNKEDNHRLEGGAYHTAVNIGAFLTGTFPPPELGFVLPLPDDYSNQRNTTKSIALFGQGTYSFTDNLDITLGLRFTREEKDFQNTGFRGAGLYVTESYDIAVSESWNSPTYKLVANYHLNDDTMVYLSAASGFKSGGFNGTSATEIAARTPFDEETAFNMELGFKSMLLDNRLRLNGALFKTSYEDLQVLQAFDDGIDGNVDPLITRNAGKAISHGLELEATLAVTENLQLSATYAYLDTEYTQLDGNLQQHEGNRLRNAPENALSLAASYDRTLPGGASINARAEYIAKDEAFQDVENREHAAIPAYRVTNLRLAYTTENERWEIAGWVNNAFDEEYLLHNYDLPPFSAIHVPALPRTLGIDLTWRNF